jgi:hypothetical protein
MSTVSGYIFRTRRGQYYLANGRGYTDDKRDAYVYTIEDMAKYIRHNISMAPWTDWGSKRNGKWIPVYE